jgi:hypothetical protein
MRVIGQTCEENSRFCQEPARHLVSFRCWQFTDVGYAGISVGHLRIFLNCLEHLPATFTPLDIASCLPEYVEALDRLDSKLISDFLHEHVFA